jgi:hypothetical protein
VLPAALALTFAGPRLLPVRRAVRAASSAVPGGAPPAARLLRALALHVVFFASAGALLWLLAAAAGSSPAGAPALPTCVAALALAWATGFVVPGAAAGIGVREAMLVIALEGALAPEIGAAVALALRVATTAGDGIFCVLALTLPLPEASRPPVFK